MASRVRGTAGGIRYETSALGVLVEQPWISYDPEYYRGACDLMKWFRAFIASNCERANNPLSGWPKTVINKEQARKELRWMVHRSINLRGGLGPLSNGDDINGLPIACYWRDQQRLRDIANRVRVYQFETPECKRLFGHLLSDQWEV